jgi:nucleoside-diphosphate-sugar epimerase
MSEKVLITGGAGYIGSVLTGRLLESGYSVTVLDSLIFKQRSLLAYCRDPKFDFVFGDSRDERVLSTLIPRHDVIIPLAALVGVKLCDQDPATAELVNHHAILSLLKLRSSSQPIISPCTNSGYGTKTGEVFCTEETPLEPISVYGVTKVKAERALLDSTNTISLRLATVFGVSPRMRVDLLVNDFVYKAMTDRYLVLYEKHFKRNYVHIDDVAACFIYCIEHFDDMKEQAYNVGLNDVNLSKEELALKIKQYVPDLYIHTAEVGTDPDKRNYIVSNDKIAAKGFRASNSLDKGIQDLMKAYRMMELPDSKTR